MTLIGPMFLTKFGLQCDESKFDVIESLAECRKALSNLISATNPASRRNGVSKTISSSNPKGCYYDYTDWQTYFNTHATGWRNSHATQVCKFKGTIIILYIR